MGPKIMDGIVGRQSWIVSRMAIVDIFGFFMWTASLSGGDGLLRRRDLVVGVCVNIKSIFNGGVCLFTFIYKPGEPCYYHTCPSQYR